MVDKLLTRILYIEDDSGLSRLLQKSLQRRGYTVDTAVDGEVGLLMLETGRYDLLLLDYNMPYCGGLDVIRALAEKGALLPTIMVTGQGNEEIAVEALKLGVSDYIVKDVEMKYLELLPAIIDRVWFQQQIRQERQQMAAAMQESEERYRKLVEMSPEGIALHLNGTVSFLNRSGAKILGAPGPEQMVGKSMFDIVHPELHEVVRERMRFLAETGTQTPWLEEQFVRCDGAVIDVEVTAASFLWQGQQMTQLIFHDITERKLVEARLQRLALYDALTGLPNRTLFFDRMNQLLALAKRNNYVLALLFLDLDGFKQVNDTFGHDVGDELLRQVAVRLGSVMRKCDTIARMGGDEFVGLCGRITAADDAAVVAEKIIALLQEPYIAGEVSCTIGVSIGISIYPDDGDDSDTLLKKADIAMYRVKQGKHGGYVFFGEMQDADGGGGA
ncbi:MAG: diguanylate cyclase [Desulfobulbaceae bacterium]|nr:diguanylate cyclase [Desulfobulbaceae bacterium]